MNILIYSPAPRDYRPLSRMLRQHGAQVECCTDQDACYKLLTTFKYDAIIYLHETDIESARNFFERWKSQSSLTCFAMLTRNQSALERGRGLALGMDIYQIEPYSYCDLLIELTTEKVRRAKRQPSITSTELFKVDVLARTIQFRDNPLKLSKTEFSLLNCLIRRRGMVLSRVQLWEEVWPGRDYPLGNAIDVHIARIRPKLLPLPLIQTIHGIGYRMRADI